MREIWLFWSLIGLVLMSIVVNVGLKELFSTQKNSAQLTATTNLSSSYTHHILSIQKEFSAGIYEVEISKKMEGTEKQENCMAFYVGNVTTGEEVELVNANLNEIGPYTGSAGEGYMRILLAKKKM